MSKTPVVLTFDTLTKAHNFLTIMGMYQITEKETPTSYYEEWGNNYDGSDWATISADNDGFGKVSYIVRDYSE
jgi:hypothetical protein